MVLKGNRLVGKLLRSSIKELGLNNIKLQKRIFEGRLISIVHYGSELWGCEKGMGLERIQLMYFKRLLGLNDRLNSLVMRGDLGFNTLRSKRLVKMVKFLVHYGSELWGCEKGMGLEKIQLRYFKRPLGLNDRLNSLVMRGDLGLNTLRSKRLVKMVKFWEKITSLPEDRLVKVAYREMIKDNRKIHGQIK